MSIIVKFEDPPGEELNTRQFLQGEPVHITVNGTTSTGAPDTLAAVELFIYGGSFPSFYDSGRLNILGNWDTDVVMPYVDTRATVTVITKPTLGFGEQRVEIPISVGNVTPEPPPEEKSALNEMLKWTAIGIGVLAAGYVAVKLIPQRTRQ